ncbi:hypothetical protein FS837_009538 [Tulasnella sp. UAMH 9824]|nr:hypothetical protein FS837_009538 [Tulasnella sp. UAMH 9824]
MEFSSATSSAAPHRPASLLLDKTTVDVPPLPQLEHQQPEHMSPASTPSPTTASPTSLMFPDHGEDDAIVVDASNDGDHDHEGSPVDDDAALVRSPAALSTAFPTPPSLAEQAPASPVKPSRSPLQRSLSQLSSLSLSTRSLAQSQQQQLLLSPSIVTPSLTLSPSRRSTAGSPTQSPTQPRPQLQPSTDTVSASTSLLPPPSAHNAASPAALPTPQDATPARPSSSQAAGNLGPSIKAQAEEEEEKEVEETLNTTLTSSTSGDALKTSAGPGASSSVAVDDLKREEQEIKLEEKELSPPVAPATIKVEEVEFAAEKQAGGAATSKGKGKEKAKADTSFAGSDVADPSSSSSPKPYKFSGSRMARKSAQHQHSRQSYASPDPFYNPNSTTNVYINGLPPFFTHEQLTRLASEFGKVLSSRVFHRFSQIKPNGAGQQQGSYETIEDATRCVTALRKYSDLHPSFARTQRLPSARPQQPTTAEGLLDKHRPEYRGSPEAPDVDAPRPPSGPYNKDTRLMQQPPPKLPNPRQPPAKEEEVDVLIQGLPADTTPESVQSLIGDRIVPLSISLLPIGTEHKREGRQIAYVKLGSRKDANDVISKLHMTRVLGFGNNDRSTVPPTLQVVEISPTLPHDSANVNMQASNLPYGSPSPPRHPAPGDRLHPTGPEYATVPLDQWGAPMQPVPTAQHLPSHRIRSSSGGSNFAQQQQAPSVFDAHPLLASQLLPQPPPLQLPGSASLPLASAARSSAALLNQNQNQRFGARTQPGFANLGLGLPGQLQQLQHAMPFLQQDRNPVDVGAIGLHGDLNLGGRRAVSMPFPQVLPPLPSTGATAWLPLSASASAISQVRAQLPPSPTRATAASGATGPNLATIRPFVPSAAALTNLNPGPAAPRAFSAGHLQVGQNSIPLTVNQQAAQAYSARFRQRAQKQQGQDAQAPPIWDTGRTDGTEPDLSGDLAPQAPQAPQTAVRTTTPAPSRRRAFRRNGAANS